MPRIVISMLLVLATACIAGDAQETQGTRPKDSWMFSFLVNVTANQRTTIQFSPRDRSNAYTVFDNILDRDRTLELMFQPYCWDADKYRRLDSTVIVPLPPAEEGEMYFLTIVSPDTVKRESMLILR